MIPVSFSYTKAGSLDEALAALGAGAKPISGGMSLIPMLRLRLAAPDAVVDVGGLDLAGVREEGGELVIGALTRHRDVAGSDAVRSGCRALAEAAAGIGSPAVRNRGTIGGSIAHADPHADVPAVLLAAGGSVTAASARGTRSIAAADLFVDYLQTSLAEDEMIVDVRVPTGAGQSAYAKFHRRAIDWSIVGAACVIRDGKAQVGLTGVASTPVRAAGFEDVVNGGGSLEEAVRRAGDGLSPMEDLDGSAEYKRHLAGVLARRAYEAARG